MKTKEELKQIVENRIEEVVNRCYSYRDSFKKNLNIFAYIFPETGEVDFFYKKQEYNDMIEIFQTGKYDPDADYRDLLKENEFEKYDDFLKKEAVFIHANSYVTNDLLVYNIIGQKEFDERLDKNIMSSIDYDAICEKVFEEFFKTRHPY